MANEKQQPEQGGDSAAEMDQGIGATSPVTGERNMGQGPLSNIGVAKPQTSTKAGPFEQFRDRFQTFDWSRGYSGEELRQELAEIPAEVWKNYQFPGGRRFYGFDEFWNHVGAQSGQPPAKDGEGGGSSKGR